MLAEDWNKRITAKNKTMEVARYLRRRRGASDEEKSEGAWRWPDSRPKPLGVDVVNWLLGILWWCGPCGVVRRSTCKVMDLGIG